MIGFLNMFSIIFLCCIFELVKNPYASIADFDNIIPLSFD